MSDTINTELEIIIKHLLAALNSSLEGTCKRKGLAHLQAAIVMLKELQEQAKNGS
jgi:hypothetical protein